jgi:hypothetical protein
MARDCPDLAPAGHFSFSFRFPAMLQHINTGTVRKKVKGTNLKLEDTRNRSCLWSYHTLETHPQALYLVEF